MSVTGPASRVDGERDLFTIVDDVAATAQRCAPESERLRRLAPGVVDALKAGGLLTLTVPVAYGGPGIALPELVEVLVRLGQGDGAAGWCCMIGNTTASLAAFTDPDAAQTIFRDRAVATAGVFAPNGAGTRVEGGWQVDGRWAWGSGSQHASWVTGGTRCDDDRMRVCWFPASDIEFHDTWHTVGLRGTGSLDFSVTGAVVPEPFAAQPGPKPIVDEPLANFPNFTLLGVGVAAVGLGIARRAVDELVILASGKVPQYSSRSLADNPFAQIELARAEARWAAAYAFVSNAVADAWDRAAAGSEVAVADRVRIRLAAAHAASECVAVADAAWTLAGGTAVSDSGTIGRCMRDAHMVTQHIMVAPKLMETLGKFYIGADFRDTMI